MTIGKHGFLIASNEALTFSFNVIFEKEKNNILLTLYVKNFFKHSPCKSVFHDMGTRLLLIDDD
ncbi:hypothetical protein BpHYR1_043065 [Brachionus plicatilis]|uniref:Uncharacterized protein n=1 Tax=Brachionus plicatilis TaxID=10195 RepID=A0A3M7RF96_BRAPC|nr:hypothetical protein BpHYR1_043065 [Brachionus plicatilis]